MTIIAGLKIADTPILIGDLVISRGTQRTDTMKKIAKMSDKFVLGWCGNRMAAEEIYKNIESTFNGKTYGFEEIKSFLVNYGDGKRDPSNLSASFIGWIVENGNPVCFVWYSSSPEDFLVFDEPVSLGIGADKYDADMKKMSLEFMYDEIMNSNKSSERHEIAAIIALGSLGNLMKGEFVSLSSDTPDAKTYGLGYEVLYYNGAAFEYLTDVTYFAAIWKIATNKADDISVKVVPCSTRIRVRSTTLLSELTHLDKKSVTYFIRRPGLTDRGRKNLIKQIDKRKVELDKLRQSQTARYYSVTCLFFEDHTNQYINSRVIIQPHSEILADLPDSKVRITVEKEGVGIELSIEQIRESIDFYLKSLVR